MIPDTKIARRRDPGHLASILIRAASPCTGLDMSLSLAMWKTRGNGPGPGQGYGRAYHATKYLPRCTSCDDDGRDMDRGPCCIPTMLHVGGVSHSEDGETATRWMLVSREDFDAYMERQGYDTCDPRDMARAAEDITGWNHDYGGPGRWFWGGTYARLTRTRVLITSRGGYDI